MKKLIAFTLAEILIVIGIIGIVAENTIPVLAKNVESAQYISGLKVGYATWNQALTKMATDVGCPGDLTCFFNSSNTDVMGAQVIKYFKVIKTCTSAQSGCFSNTINLAFNNTSAATGYDATTYRFITKDGMTFSIGAPFQNCGDNETGLIKTTNLDQICSIPFLMDVNGLKKPNTAGRDIFFFYITTGKGPALYPYGGRDFAYAPFIGVPWYNTSNGLCNYGYLTGTSKDGRSCAARIIDQGWQMKY